VIIRPLVPEDEACWEHFLQDPRPDLYCTAQWRDFTEAVTGAEPIYFGALEGTRLLGLLPCFLYRSSYGSLINSLPWFGTPGACSLLEREAEARAGLLMALSQLIQRERPLSTTLILGREDPQHRLYRAALGPGPTEQRLGQLSLLPSKAPIIEMLHQKSRNQLRKGLKQGFEVRISETDEDWRALWSLHREAMEARGGRFKPWTHIQALRSLLSQRALYVAYHQGEVIAALLIAWQGETTEYLIPVIHRSYRSLQPLSVLIHAAMQDAQAGGRLRWNWGGTWLSQRSLYRFKARWGASEQPYRYLISGDLPRLRAYLPELSAAFPFAYLYPFSLL